MRLHVHKWGGWVLCGGAHPGRYLIRRCMRRGCWEYEHKRDDSGKGAD